MYRAGVDAVDMCSVEEQACSFCRSLFADVILYYRSLFAHVKGWCGCSRHVLCRRVSTSLLQISFRGIIDNYRSLFAHV